MKACLAVLCSTVFAAGLTMSAQSIPAELPPVAPEVSAVASSAGRRVVIVEGGFDVISHTVYLQWLREPRSREEKPEVVATVLVGELPEGFWRVSDLKFVDPTTAAFSAYFRLSDRPHEVTITFAAPARYTLRGDLTVREDEI